MTAESTQETVSEVTPTADRDQTAQGSPESGTDQSEGKGTGSAPDASGETEEERQRRLADRAAYMRKYRRGEVGGKKRKTKAEREEEERKRAEFESTAKMVEHAVSETVNLLADGAHVWFLRPDDPRFGDERSQKIGKAWSRLLARHIDKEGLESLPYILAGGMTAGSLMRWGAEVRAARAGARPPATVTQLRPEDDGEGKGDAGTA